MCGPYRGEKSYIFLSYAHKNREEAMELVRHLQQAGYRVWYDEGIDPGTEWDENIAAHVERCGYFIALVSEAYLASDNCRDELNFARDEGKPRLLVYLEEVTLPAGMRMRLSRLQAVFRYRYAEQGRFYQRLFKTAGLNSCLEIGSSAEERSLSVENPAQIPTQIVLKPEEDWTERPVAGEGIKPIPKSITTEQKTADVKASGRCGRGAEWTLDTEGCLRITGFGLMDDYIYECAPWSEYGAKIITLKVGEGIVRIGHSAFKDCENIRAAALPSTLREIGSWGFADCRKLEQIDLSEGLEKIGYGAFYECKSLQSIKIPDRVTEIGDWAFYSCTKLKRIDLPEKIHRIGGLAFFECEALEKVQLFGIKRLERGVFFNCRNLRVVELPCELEEIGENTFKNCENLIRISFPRKLKKIGKKAFKGCTSLQNVYLPAVKQLEESVFEGCTALCRINIPKDCGRKLNSVPRGVHIERHSAG